MPSRATRLKWCTWSMSRGLKIGRASRARPAFWARGVELKSVVKIGSFRAALCQLSFFKSGQVKSTCARSPAIPCIFPTLLTENKVCSRGERQVIMVLILLRSINREKGTNRKLTQPRILSSPVSDLRRLGSGRW